MKNDKTIPDGSELYIPAIVEQPSILDITTVQDAGWDFIVSSNEDAQGSYFYVDVLDSSGTLAYSSEITEESYNSYNEDSSNTIELVGVPLFNN